MKYRFENRDNNEIGIRFHYPVTEIDRLCDLYQITNKDSFMTQVTSKDFTNIHYYSSRHAHIAIVKRLPRQNELWITISVLAIFGGLFFVQNTVALIAIGAMLLVSAGVVHFMDKCVGKDIQTIHAIDNFIPDPYSRLPLIIKSQYDPDVIRRENELYGLIPVKKQLDQIDVSLLDREDQEDYYKMRSYIASLYEGSNVRRTAQEKF